MPLKEGEGWGRADGVSNLGFPVTCDSPLRIAGMAMSNQLLPGGRSSHALCTRERGTAVASAHVKPLIGPLKTLPWSAACAGAARIRLQLRPAMQLHAFARDKTLPVKIWHVIRHFEHYMHASTSYVEHSHPDLYCLHGTIECAPPSPCVASQLRAASFSRPAIARISHAASGH